MNPWIAGLCIVVLVFFVLVDLACLWEARDD